VAIPPLFAVDHILLRGAAATSVQTIAMQGSDHHALITEIGLAN
jgi:endonuclease/exonuclease/phosphatase (EEP) superfamily protein YafD